MKQKPLKIPDRLFANHMDWELYETRTGKNTLFDIDYRVKIGPFECKVYPFIRHDMNGSHATDDWSAKIRLYGECFWSTGWSSLDDCMDLLRKKLISFTSEINNLKFKLSQEQKLEAIWVGQKPNPDDRDVHTEHCCKLHGCKYNSKDCTVQYGTKLQSGLCECCEVYNDYD